MTDIFRFSAIAFEVYKPQISQKVKLVLAAATFQLCFDADCRCGLMPTQPTCTTLVAPTFQFPY